MRSLLRVSPFLVVVAIFLVGASALGEVANRYSGRVILFNKRPPTRWANDGVFHRFVNLHKVGGIEENDEGEWVIEYMAFFGRPVGDREVSVRFYDATSRSGQYITAYTLYLNDPRQRIVGGRARLERPEFQPNHYYAIKVATKGRTIAKLTKFALIGEEPERSGEVIFSDDEARGRKAPPK